MPRHKHDPKELLRERLRRLLTDEGEVSACLERAPEIVRAESGDPRFIVDGKRTTLTDLARRLSGKDKQPRKVIVIEGESSTDDDASENQQEGDIGDEQEDIVVEQEDIVVEQEDFVVEQEDIVVEQEDIVVEQEVEQEDEVAAAKFDAQIGPLPAAVDTKKSVQAQSKFEMLSGMHQASLSVDKALLARLLPPGAVSNPVAIMKYHASVVSAEVDKHPYLSSDDMLKLKKKVQLILHPDKHLTLSESDRERPAEVCNTLNASREWSFKDVYLFKPPTPSSEDEEQPTAFMDWEAWETDNIRKRVFYEYSKQMETLPTVHAQALCGLSYVLELCENQQDRLQEMTADYNKLVVRYNDLRQKSKDDTEMCLAEIEKVSARRICNDSNKLRVLEGRVKKTRRRLQNVLKYM